MITENLDWKSVQCDPGSGKVIFRYADIKDLPEWPAGPLLEIIRGVLYMVPSPTLLHQEIALILATSLRLHVEKHNLGKVFTGPVDVVLSEENVVVPDVLFVARDRKHILHPKKIGGAPDLVVEILSSNRKRDLHEKRTLYEKYGVPEYWVVDPQNRVVLVFRQESDAKGYARTKIPESGVVQARNVSRFEIPAGELFQPLK